MKIIIGLGNPDKKYQATRHNIGFTVLEHFQKTFSGNFNNFAIDKKFFAEISEGQISGEKIILAKPQTYYNESGKAASALLNYYKIGKESLTVIHDDISLPLGKLRIIDDSSAGGNNGVASIIGALGAQDFIRIKFGVWNEIKEKAGATDFVLGKFGLREKKLMKETVNKAAQAIVDLIEAYPDIAKTQNIYN